MEETKKVVETTETSEGTFTKEPNKAVTWLKRNWKKVLGGAALIAGGIYLYSKGKADGASDDDDEPTYRLTFESDSMTEDEVEEFLEENGATISNESGE